MLSREKLNKLESVNAALDNKYGEKGFASRAEFDAKTQAWYYAELLRDERKKRRITQQQLANIIGKSRTYITALEKGQTDMQLSTFIMISRALEMKFSLVLE